ncbi:hypothetical protein [Salsuginibacillus kocurii]|uniref:hypothetical protein n=1 Tax=Salsuginibacillus kocurii TaxID=427078 RepID=UPI0003806DB4|nr:hypothetical protein [Salsuginibacillus kocurii]
MDENIKHEFEKSKSTDKQEQYEAYQHLLAATEQKVDWAYDIWDQLIEDLSDKDNHQRARAAQYLANLAKSDPENRMLRDFSKLWKVTKDEKFVTARHSLKSIWKVGLAGPEQKELVMHYMVDRFQTCTVEKNYTLIRSDIIQNLKYLYDYLQEESIKETALMLIENVEETKYQKKYRSIWK